MASLINVEIYIDAILREGFTVACNALQEILENEELDASSKYTANQALNRIKEIFKERSADGD